MRVRVLTFNMGDVAQPRAAWLAEINAAWTPISESRQYDVLLVTVQEDFANKHPYGQFGAAIGDYLAQHDFVQVADVETAPRLPSAKFAVKVFAFARSTLRLQLTGVESLCVGSSAARRALCTKSGVAVRLESPASVQPLIFVGAHLPINNKKTDLGLAERVDALGVLFSQIVAPLLRRRDRSSQQQEQRAQTPEADAAIVLAGDLNFRRDADTGEDQLQQIFTSGRWSCIAGRGWSEAAPLEFAPTCKLRTCQAPAPQPTSQCSLCRANARNVAQACYETETAKGRRVPSHCDRVLLHGTTLRGWRYEPFSRAPAVQQSDHNAVVADLDWLPLQHRQLVQKLALISRPLLLRVYFVRHALSCTNVMQQFGRSLLDKTVRRYAYRDPVLTDRGVSR